MKDSHRVLFPAFAFVLLIANASCVGTFSKTTLTNVIKTSDAEESSQKLPESFVDVSFLNVDAGWAISKSSIWKTVDGGSTWSREFKFAPKLVGGISLAPDLEKIQTLPDGTVFVLGSNDGGLMEFNEETKSVRTIFPGDKGLIRGFHFTDKKRGWVVGQSNTKKGGHWDAVAFSTADGVGSWVSETAPRFNDCDCAFYDVKSLRNGFTLLVGDLLAKVDTTQNHIVIESDLIREKVFGTLSSVRVIDDKVTWILSNQANKFLVSTDGGNTWISHTLADADDIDDLLFVSDENVIALANNRIWLSHNGGDTWEKGTQLKGHALFLYQMPQSGQVFAVGDSFETVPDSVAKNH